MKGNEFRAKVRLTTIRGKVLAMPGETCEQVPEASLPFLLDDGDIEPIVKLPAASRRKKG